MPSIFLDANIFFAAVRSSMGGSYFIIEFAKKQNIRAITVAYVLAECIPEKDVPIILDALLGKANMLITLDQKHFLKNEKLAKLDLPLTVMTPGDFIQKHIL